MKKNMKKTEQMLYSNTKRFLLGIKEVTLYIYNVIYRKCVLLVVYIMLHKEEIAGKNLKLAPFTPVQLLKIFACCIVIDLVIQFAKDYMENGGK